jgi:hypothetical protein
LRQNKSTWVSDIAQYRVAAPFTIIREGGLVMSLRTIVLIAASVIIGIACIATVYQRPDY